MVTKPKEQDLDTAARLMEAATDVFAEKGFGGATVKEIADRAGVNISLISYHFNGKEGIFRACLEKFGREQMLHAERMLTPPENVEDFKAKLKMWMLEFMQCHVEEKNVCSIMHRENLMEHKFMMEVFQNTFIKAFEANTKFFDVAKKKGIMRKDVDSMLLGGIVFGTLIHLGKNIEIQKLVMGVSIENEKYRMQAAEQFLSILLNGIT